MATVEEYLITGQLDLGHLGGSAGSGGVPRPPSVQPCFPYVEGPPGMVSHYLWRVIMLIGWSILDFLGYRVSSWGYLRAVAVGFRSCATMAISIWLRRTSHLYIATPQATADAVDTYLQSG